MTRILGVDPGLRRTGYGVIETTNSSIKYLDSGTIVIPSDAILSIRLKTIAQCLSDIVQQFNPHEVAMEKVFVNSNPQSTLLLGHARGAAMTGLSMLELDVSEYTALQIKKAVVGHGHAKKAQVQLMVQHLLRLNALPQPDPADALACAICHAHASPLNRQLQNHRTVKLSHNARMRGGRIID